MKNAFGSKYKDVEYQTYKNIKNLERTTVKKIMK